MILDHVVSESQNIGSGRRKGDLPQVQQISQDVPSDGVAHIPQEVDSLRIEGRGRLDEFMQQDELIHCEYGQWPANRQGIRLFRFSVLYMQGHAIKSCTM